MKKQHVFLMACLLTISLIFIACDSGSSGGGSGNPEPGGTYTVKLIGADGFEKTENFPAGTAFSIPELPILFLSPAEDAILPTGAIGGKKKAFKGWNTKADGTGTAYYKGDTITLTADITLYAQWKAGFSISKSKSVFFAKGNLVATIDALGTPTAWKFADHQYDCLRAGGANQTIGTAAGDVDLFGWSGDTAAAGWGISISGNASDYSGNFKDWGTNIGSGWFTLSRDEFIYLKERDNNTKFASATVNGIEGLVFLPDVWTTPDGCTFTPGRDGGWSTNTYDSAKWTEMENAGALFIPYAYNRGGSTVNSSYSIIRSSERLGITFMNDAFDDFSGSPVFGGLVRLAIEAD